MTQVGGLEVLLKLKNELGPQLAQAQKQVEGFRSAWGNLVKGLTLTALATSIHSVMKAQSEAEAGVNKLNLALANQGKFSEEVSKRLRDQAAALQETTAFSDDAVLGVQGVLASFGQSEEQIKATTQTVLDFAAATGTDITAAANLMGKAFVGSTAALSRYGIVVEEGLGKTAKFDSAIAQLNQRFSGSAATQMQTYEGQLKGITNQFGEVQEAAGRFFGVLFSSGKGDAFGAIRTGLKWVGDFIGGPLITFVGNFKAAWYEAFAAAADGVAKLLDLASKLPGLSDLSKHAETARAIAEGQRDLATETRDAAKAMREQGGTFAQVANGAGAAATGIDKLTAAEKKLIEEQKKFSALVKAQISDRMIDEAIAGKPSQLGLERMGVSDLLAKAKASAKDLSASLGPGIAKEIDFSKLGGFGLPDQAVTKFAFAGKTAADAFAEMAQTMRDAKAPAQDIGDALRGVGASAEEAAAAIAKTVEKLSLGASLKAGLVAGLKGLPQVILGAIQGGGDIGKAIGTQLGGSIFSDDVVKNLTGKLSGVLGTTLGGALGSILPGLGSLIGSQLGGLISKGISALGSKLGIGGNKEIMALNDTRDAFLASQGGFVELQKKLQGLSNQDLVKKIFDAKTVDQFNSAVGEVNRLLGLQGEANEALNAAVEKYGFTVEELGPKFRQQELDTMAGELLQDYELLKASGIDLNLIHEKMAPNMSEYIQTAIRAGTSVPEAMRPVIEAMITNGQLLDENGQAYASAEAAGITFAQTMSEQFSTLIQKIGDLVAALTGVPNVSRTVTVDTQYTGEASPDTGGGGGGGDYGGVPEDYRAASGFHAMVSKPTRILVGEAGAERVDVTPQGQPVPGSGGGGLTVNASFPADPTQTHEARRDLASFQYQQLVRQLRADPLVRQMLRTDGGRG